MNNTWQTADKKSLQGLKEMLKEYTLDPTMLNYGKYCSVSKKESFHPKHTPENDRINISASFIEASWMYEGETNKSDYLEAKKMISKHLKSDKFQKAFREKYNCVTIELTYYLNYDLLKKLGRTGPYNDWYNTIKSKLYFNIDNWFTPEFKKEWKRLEEYAQTLKNITGYKIEPHFCELHFTDEEYEELKTELLKYAHDKTTIALHQAVRNTKTNPPSRLKEYKSFKLKSTGRRLKFDPDSYYCFSWYEIDPVINIL